MLEFMGWITQINKQQFLSLKLWSDVAEWSRAAVFLAHSTQLWVLVLTQSIQRGVCMFSVWAVPGTLASSHNLLLLQVSLIGNYWLSVSLAVFPSPLEQKTGDGNSSSWQYKAPPPHMDPYRGVSLCHWNTVFTLTRPNDALPFHSMFSRLYTYLLSLGNWNHRPRLCVRLPIILLFINPNWISEDVIAAVTLPLLKTRLSTQAKSLSEF